MTNKTLSALELAKKLIMDGFFSDVPPMIDDCMLSSCGCCNKKAWLIEDIKHQKDCRVGKALKAIQIAEREK